MFCKNCGSAINAGEERCSSCQFKVGYGKGYCQICGKKLTEDETVCTQCGNETSMPVPGTKAEPVERKPIDMTAAADKTERHTAYKSSFLRINIFTLCADVIALLLLVCFIFLPIYRCRFEATLDDIESLEQLGEALANDGYLEKNFSAFDDFRIIMNQFSELGEEKDSLDVLIIFESGLFLFFEFIYTGILVGIIVKKIYDGVNGLRNIDNHCILKYNEIKKSGRQETKPNFFQKQSVYTIMTQAAFDIIFTRYCFNLFFVGGSKYVRRYMINFTGFSWVVVVAVIFVAAYVVLRNMIKKDEESIKLSIAKEE